MTITYPELTTYFPANNYVLLRPVVDMTRYHGTTLDLVVPTVDGEAWDKFKSAPVVCEVITAPRRLICATHKVVHESIEELDVSPEVKARLWEHRREAKFSEATVIERPVPGSMMWHTPVQVKSCDVVWVNPNAIINAIKIECEGRLYFLIKYDQMYLKKSGDSVTMLNGYILIDVLEDTPDWHRRAEQIGLFIPPQLKKMEFQDRLAVVRYADDPVEYVMQDRYDDPAIKAGDTVLLKYKVNRRLEPGYRFFAKEGDLRVSRRANILAIL